MNTLSIPYKFHPSNTLVLIPENASGHQLHRLKYFADWLDQRGQRWSAPDLAAYRDYIMSADRFVPGAGGEPKPSPLSPASAQAHLSTIRGRYQQLLDSNDVRLHLYSVAPADASPADKKAFVDEMLIRLENAVKPAQSKVRVKKSQDRIDADHLRLTKAQANALLAAPKNCPHNTPLQALRDTAIIALLLCTGIREMELCALNVPDLRQRAGDELVLHIREGKGAKERTVPYGELSWALAIVDKWLAAAGIESGPVFRGFYKGGRRIRPGRLTVRAINQIMDRYPIAIEGQQRVVNPHDCRRTYARRLYEAAVDPVVIQQNLGHSDLKTTLGYIGALNMDQRRPPAIYSQPDLAALVALI
jgi:integrase